ncbi:MAG: DUF924 family protein, partial [Acetobacteraceae bacterium]
DGDRDVFRPRWFERSDEFDAACRVRFAQALEQAKAGAFNAWTATPRGTLALIILLDQMSRNLHRGSAEAFAADAKARAVANDALDREVDQTLHPMEQMFLYLPFEHSENAEDQDTSVRLGEALSRRLPDDLDALTHAHQHRDVIRRFGRFPHRNVTLGRVSTTEETAWLADHPTGF